MSGIIFFALRILFAASLYCFLALILFLLWKQIHLTSIKIHQDQIPSIILSMIDDGNKKIMKSFSCSEILIGRDPSCNFPVHSATASTFHIRMSYHHDQWWAEDLDSTNGTRINGEPVTSPIILINGDEILCGDSLIHIQLPNRLEISKTIDEN